MDPRRHNGAIFLGLQGIAVKSHGGSDAVSFANAIAIAHSSVTADLANCVSSDLIIGAAPLESLPDCQRIQDALHELGEPVPTRPKQAGHTFPIDYRLPVVDPRVRLPGPDCLSLTLSEVLARLKPHQVSLVVLLGGYRTNGPYSRRCRCWAISVR